MKMEKKEKMGKIEKMEKMEKMVEIGKWGMGDHYCADICLRQLNKPNVNFGKQQN